MATASASSPRTDDVGATRPWATVAVGAAIGALVAWWMVAGGLLDDLLGVGGDAGSGFAAFRYFVEGPWTFPLLAVEGLTDPEGQRAVVAFVDGVPAWALPAKALGFLPWSTEDWIRVWYVVCFVAQGAAAGLVAATFGLRTPAAAVLAACCATMPAFLVRVSHPGLLAQFTLLLMWAVVARLWRERDGRSLWWGVAVIWLALLAHPYLAVMCAVLLVAAVASMLATGRIARADVLRVGGPALLGSLPLLALLGYFGGDPGARGGYGAFGMPLLSPLWIQRSGFAGGRPDVLATAGGSIEGLNYLGLGVVVAGAVTLVVRRRVVAAFLRREQVMVVILGALALVAVSPVVYLAGDTPVFRLADDADALRPLTVAVVVVVLGAVSGLLLWATHRRPAWGVVRPAATTFAVLVALGAVALVVLRPLAFDLLEGFRASGRFFWVVADGLIIATVVLIDRAPMRASWRSAAWVALVGVQLVDVSPYRDLAVERMATSPARVERIEALSTLIAAHDRVHLEPPWDCTDGLGGIAAFQDVVIAASVAGRPVDDHYAGRSSPTDCAEVLPGPAPDTDGSTLDVFVAPVSPPYDPERRCLEDGPLTLCSERWDELARGPDPP